MLTGLVAADGQEHHIAGLALHQRRNRGLSSCPQHEVAFPMTGDGAIGNLGRSVGDEDHVSDVAPGIFATMRAAAGAPRT